MPIAMLSADAIAESAGTRVGDGLHICTSIADAVKDCKSEKHATNKLIQLRADAVRDGAYLRALFCDCALRNIGYEE